MTTETPKIRYLHTMVRVADKEKSLDFYINKLGLKVIREVNNPQYKFDLIFLAPEGQEDAQIELTYNYPDPEPEKYTEGRNFGHLCFEVPNIYEYCQKLVDQGVTINRPPRDGYMAGTLNGTRTKLPPQEPWASMPNVGKCLSMSLSEHTAADPATPRFSVGTPRTPRPDAPPTTGITLPPQTLRDQLSHMDRLTQLQDKVDQLMASFKVAYDQARRFAPPLLPDSSVSSTSEPVASQALPPGTQAAHAYRAKSITELSQEIGVHARAIDLYIESLPDISMSEEEQLEELAALDAENRSRGEQLEKVVEEATFNTFAVSVEVFRDLARQAIRFIADDQYAYLKKSAEKKRRIVEAGFVGLGF
ncbi:Glyoxalase/Bleomycin resistance protein/Dihydroxybiphenyl dioxygenase [Gonapodya prolifera JEL478]|uniref:Mediator of RNA polymerase II transcription subunit 21 n=1 Tax=Gonapodya prolifera (strain JEL478) TaxID=1344416 RepID=A0A139A8J1_GONPJ|nr:Glyoxalase/Bleomycin resistance protein/Dihydroxybiphenyl dioxygenase [Gonapodya prolifera JEL478]|eukprot:KXS12765.1 Glyoxalase/Bleomycin resistance protein/Dihydroxybiphenyl dioxygenase [Gonapodya prolifera JEL478]